MPTYTKSPMRVARFQADTLAVAGVTTSARCDAFLESRIVNDADPLDAAPKPWAVVHFDFLDPLLSAVTVTAGGVTTTYPKIAALIQAACLAQATAQGISV